MKREIVLQLLKQKNAELTNKFGVKVLLLFGSVARDESTPKSDVDLLVVMDTPNGEMDVMVEIAKSLPILPFGVDVIVRSRKTLERRKKLGDRFLREATEKGKVLYERTNPRMDG